MKVARLDRPIRASMMQVDGWRMDAAPYLSGKTDALLAVARLKTDSLAEVCSGNGGAIFNGPQFRRLYVDDPAKGVPFLGSSDMLMADLTRLPHLNRSDAESSKLSHLKIQPGMTLISCSGTIGRTVYARPDMCQMWSSQHVLKVWPNSKKIPSGYLFAYLAGRIGNVLVASGTYGGMIQHIEPQHLSDIPVPRLGRLEQKVHTAVQRAAELRAKWQDAIKSATNAVFDAVGLRDLTALEWHARHDQDLGYTTQPIHSHSFLSLNYSSRAIELAEKIQTGKHRPLLELVKKGTLNSGYRFRRIEAAPSHGIMLIGQKDLFTSVPDGRWVASWCLKNDARLEEGTTLIAAHGTLGEFELYAQAALVYGDWVNHAYTQDVMRVVPDHSQIEPGFLFAYLRSHSAFRLLRCMSYGTKLQEFSPTLLRKMPVPYPDKRVRRRIHDSVMAAFSDRAEADRLERDAIKRVELAIDEG